MRKSKNDVMFPAGIEPATSPVWRVRDNHYTKETDESNLKTKYLVSIFAIKFMALWANR